MLADTHAHLDFTDDLDGWLERAKVEGVNKIVCVGTSIEASKKCTEIADQYSNRDLQIYSTVGIHAQDGKEDVEKYGKEYIQELKKLAQISRKVVAVGECGFDFYLDDEKRIKEVDKDRIFQKELFEAQIGLALELNLPLVVHCRNAWTETFDLFSKFQTQNSKLKGVFHSWTGDWEDAKRALELEFYISFSGIVTFKNARNVAEVAKKIPLEKVLIETDSPFLSPEPLRGRKNEPGNVRIIAEFIASLRNLPPGQLFDMTCQNAKNLFGV